MDITNYTWVNRFEPDKSIEDNSASSTTSTSTSKDQPDTDNKKSGTSNTIPIVIGAVGGVVGIAFIAIIGFIVYKCCQSKKDHQNRQDNILRIPGNRESYM